MCPLLPFAVHMGLEPMIFAVTGRRPNQTGPMHHLSKISQISVVTVNRSTADTISISLRRTKELTNIHAFPLHPFLEEYAMWQSTLDFT